MKYRILLIEDEQGIAAILKLRLEAKGYEVSLAFDGEEGLSKIWELSPDLVLLDIVLPKKSGTEILVEVKADESYKHMPIILVTGLSPETSGVKSVIDQADAYFLKPFDFVELSATIADLLKGAPKHAE